jgi:hypothetical protein
MANLFPMEQQAHSEWCWAAVGVSIERYFSPASHLKQCELANEVLGSDKSCNDQMPPELNTAEYLQNVLRHLGALHQTLEGPLAFCDIYTQIVGERLPVCAEIEWFGLLPGGHFVVVYGCPVTASGEQWVDVADPFYGFSTMLYDEFVNSYLDDGEWAYTFLVKQPNLQERDSGEKK